MHDFLILSYEQFWVGLQPFLLGRGYQLRPRYSPDWKPPWLQVEVKPGEEHPPPIRFEEALSSNRAHMLDAIRTSDGCKVVFKRVKTSTDEIPIALLLSSAENRKDPRNCCVPILDVVMIPGTDDEALLVMPQLLGFAKLPYRFLGEFAEFALQLLLGIEFMHEINVAHRDACWFNIMVDPTKLVPAGSHFCRWNSHDGTPYKKFEWNTRWSVRPVKYYLIDFGESSLCSSKDAQVVGKIAQDKTAPELSTEIPYNPFMLDIYHVGNVFNQCIEYHTGLNDYRELARLMTHPDPRQRPTASECVIMCKRINDKISKWRRSKNRVWRKTCDLYTELPLIAKWAIMCGWQPIA